MRKLTWVLLASVLVYTPSLAQSYVDIMGIIRGDSLGSQFGKKVVPTGDVNGDTIPDFLVLATGDQKVYLFHGKKGGLDTLPDLAFEHKSQLEALVDLNGDLGLDFAMRETGQQCRLSFYFGGGCLDTLQDGYAKGDSVSFFFGDAYGLFVSVGKLSNTSDRQIVIGRTVRGLDSSTIYIYSAVQNSIDSIPFLKWDFAHREGYPAGPAIGLGDINSDGFDDLAIGRQASTQNGRVELYLGGASFDTLPDIVLNPPSYLTPGLAAAFGSKLAAVGDLNNDGFADFVVGASRTPLLYFGGTPLDTLPLFVLDRIGDHFVNGGDINADGYNDLLLGRDESADLTGFAYVYYGGIIMDSVVDLQIIENDLPEPAPGFGRTVASLGDIDGNGSNDFAVGSESVPFGLGEVWVFNGLLPSTDVEDEKEQLPKNFELEQNYPNPFNSSTVISYSVSKRGPGRLEIFNITGQMIKVLLDQEITVGTHKISWNGKDSFDKPVSSGVYIYRLKTGDEFQVKKMILIR